MGQEGFSSESALLYHRHLPTAVVAIEEWRADPAGAASEPSPDPAPRPRAQDRGRSGRRRGPGRRLLFGNGDVRLSYCVASAASPLYRNGTGDELLYVEAGSGGGRDRLRVAGRRHRRLRGAADLDHLPGRPRAGDPLRLLVIEASGHVGRPEPVPVQARAVPRARPFCERDLRVPRRRCVVEGEDVEVARAHARRAVALRVRPPPVRRRRVGRCAVPVRPQHRTTSSRSPGAIHQPPTVHQTFAGPNFVVCSFVPRKLDYHPWRDPDAVQPRQRRLRRGALLRAAASSRADEGPGSGTGR